MRNFINKIINSYLLAFVLCTITSQLNCTVYTSTGSGGQPSIGYQGATYTITNNPSEFRGHFQFKDGITTGDNQFIWDADGLISGTLNIGNAGNLTLHSDLKLSSTAALTCVGDNITIFGENKTIFLTGDTVINDGIVTASNLTIDGQGHKLIMERPDGGDYRSLSTNITSSLTLKNMTLIYRDSVNSMSLCRLGRFVFENLKLQFETPVGYNTIFYKPNGDDLYVDLTIRGNVEIDAPGRCVILNKGGDVDPLAVNLMIEENSTLSISPKTSFILVDDVGNPRHTANVTLKDRSSTIHFNNCNFFTSSASDVLQALQLTKGTVLFENKVNIINGLFNAASLLRSGSANTDPTKGFILGDGTAPNDVNVRMIGNAYVTVDGCFEYRHS